MIPRLATRGKLILGTALLFLLVGALHGAPPLVALSGTILTVLLAMYLSFYPTAILLRRKKIELSWWVPPGDQPGGALSADRPFQLHLAFRNHGSRKLRILSTNILAGSGLQLDEKPSATVRRGQQVEVTTIVKPLAVRLPPFISYVPFDPLEYPSMSPPVSALKLPPVCINVPSPEKPI